MIIMEIILIACMGFMMFVDIYHFVMLETRRKSLDRFNRFIDNIENDDERWSVLSRRISQLESQVEEREKKRGELDNEISRLENQEYLLKMAIYELSKDNEDLAVRSSRIRREISDGDETVKKIETRIASLSRIKEGLDIIVNNMQAVEIPYLSQSLNSIGITPSVRERLETHGIVYIGELIPLSEQYLMDIWGVGEKTVERIKTKLSENGVWFGMDVIRIDNRWYRRKTEQPSN